MTLKVRAVLNSLCEVLSKEELAEYYLSKAEEIMESISELKELAEFYFYLNKARLR